MKSTDSTQRPSPHFDTGKTSIKISDYAFLSDCQSAALVSQDGSVDWFCSPRFDSPSLFARILDPAAGHWTICPEDRFEVKRAYIQDTMVVENVFQTESGSVSITDALALGAGSRGHEIGLEVPHVLMRVIKGISGAVEMVMDFMPRMEYGLTRPLFLPADHGCSAVGGPVRLELHASVPLTITDEGAFSGFEVKAGDTVEIRLACTPSFGRDGKKPFPDGISIDETVKSWRSLTELHTGYQDLYLPEVRRSALVLQGLTYQPSGAIIAAATTSIPEKIGGDANWDYRFAWLRDISMIMTALWVAACPDEPESFFEFINLTGVGREETMQIMFGVEGERDLSEHQLQNLEGFRASPPVRIGNEAWRQKQLDVVGEVIDAAYILKDKLTPFKDSTRKLLVELAELAELQWRDPDAGMWEARDKRRHYTSSKVMCWVALDRAIKLREELMLTETQVARWLRSRDEIFRTVMERSWSEQAGAFTGAFESENLDASVLLMPLVGFLPATDDRMRATIETIYNRLCDKGCVRRWSSEENGFIICNYWLVECLALAGELARATELFEKTTAMSNDLGLFSEEVDLLSGELLGNFPQALSHVGLINAAWRLSQLQR